MNEEPTKQVDKVWGREIWFVNNEQYCGKLLIIDKGATSSYHCHKIKKETFICIEGEALLTIEDEQYILNLSSSAKTIEPGEYHKFFGTSNAVLLEVSTHHEEDDVVRLSNSKPKQ